MGYVFSAPLLDPREYYRQMKDGRAARRPRDPHWRYFGCGWREVSPQVRGSFGRRPGVRKISESACVDKAMELTQRPDFSVAATREARTDEYLTASSPGGAYG